MERDSRLRRAQLGSSDEDLLLQQDDFLSTPLVPAAKVSRISRRDGGQDIAASTSSLGPHGGTCGNTRSSGTSGFSSSSSKPAGASPASTPVASRGSVPSISSIMGEVVERAPTAAVTAPLPPMPSSHAPFPAAAHRSKSKFALSRSKQQASAVATAGPQQPQPQPQPEHQQQAQQHQHQQQDVGVQSLAQVLSMSAEERRAALEEVQGRLDPATLEFLRQRGLARQQGQQQGRQQQQQQAHTSQGSAGAAAAVPKPKGAVAGLRKGFWGKEAGTAAAAAAAAAPRAATTSTAARAPADRELGAAPSAAAGTQAVGQSKHTASTSSNSSRGQDSSTSGSLPLVAQLRFSVDGQPLLLDPQAPSLEQSLLALGQHNPAELDLPNATGPAGSSNAGAEAAAAALQVLQRDPISREFGLAPEGYSLPELLVLVRSSHAPQRVLGWRCLGAVLGKARPTAVDVGPNGQLRPRTVQLRDRDLHTSSSADGSGGDSAGAREGASPALPSSGVQWLQVWEYLLVACRLVSVARLALDDPNLGVAAGSAYALVLMLGPGAADRLLLSALELSGQLGGPQPWLGTLRRSSGAGTWEGVQQLLRQEGQQGAEEEELDAPEDIAVVDPLAGFLAMDPLPRMVYLLQHHAASDAAVPLLLLLEACAAASPESAQAVAHAKGLWPLLKGWLTGGPCTDAGSSHCAAADVGPSSTTSIQAVEVADPSGSSTDTNSGSSSAGGMPVLRMRALRLVRMLCEAAPSVASTLHRTGVLMRAAAALATQPESGPAGWVEGCMQLEALRLWRVTAQQGIQLMHMDVMYSFICRYLQPPSSSSSSPGGDSSTSPGSTVPPDAHQQQVLQWRLCMEAFLLLETLLLHALAAERQQPEAAAHQQQETDPGSPMITPGCAAAVAQEAAGAWLQPALLQQLAALLTCQTSAAAPALAAAGSGRQLMAQHPDLLVPGAAAAVGAFGAVLSFLSSYWSSLTSPTAVPLKQQLYEQLQQLGLQLLLPSAAAAATGGLQVEASRGQLLQAALQAAGDKAQPHAATTSQQVLGRSSPAVQQLGQALLQHLAATAGAGTGAVDAAKGHAPAVGTVSTAVSHAAACSAAAGVLSGLERLQQVLQAPAGAGDQGSSTEPVSVSTPPGSCPSSSSWPLLLQLAQQVVSWSTGSSCPTVLHSWDLVALVVRRPVLELLLQLARIALPGCTSCSSPAAAASEQRPAAELEQQQQQRLLVLSALLQLGVVVAPGWEELVLAGWQLALQPALLQPLLAAAQQEVARVAAAAPLQPAADADRAAADAAHMWSVLRAAAAGVRSNCTATTAASSQEPPYPPPTQWPDAAEVCSSLFAGYSAAWLSVVQLGSGADTSTTGTDPGSTQPGSKGPAQQAAAVQQYCCGRAAVSGSRLPVSQQWLLLETLAVPALGSGPGPAAAVGLAGDAAHAGEPHDAAHSRCGAGTAPGTHTKVHPVAAVVLLALGGHVLRLPALAGLPPATHLTAMLRLLYLHNCWELVQAAQDVIQLHQQQGQQQQLQECEPSWRDPLTRCAAAALTGRLFQDIAAAWRRQQQHAEACSHSSSAGTTSRAPAANGAAAAEAGQLSGGCSSQGQWPGEQMVEQLVREYGEETYGDTLVGCQLALLLSPAAGAAVQRAAWGALSQSASLHLLPPVQGCLGGKAWCLWGPWDWQLVGDMARSLAAGELGKARQSKGLAAQLALYGIAASVLDEHSWSSSSSLAGARGPGGAEAALDGRSAEQQRIQAARSEAMAVNVARGVVRLGDGGLLRELLAAAEEQGMAAGDARKALAVACHGDAHLLSVLDGSLGIRG